MNENISGNSARMPAEPVPPVTYGGVTYQIGQANNALLSPGVATKKPGNLVQAVQDAIWQPAYPDSVS